MAAFWPIGTAQIIRIVSYPIRKSPDSGFFTCDPTKKCIMPSSRERHKGIIGRGHDLRLGRSWTCVNWKTPQKRKSVPRLLSMTVASDKEVPRKDGVSTSGVGLFSFSKPTCVPGLTEFKMGMFKGIGGGEGSPGLKVACGTGSGAASCGTLSESLSATALSMESLLIWSR